MKTKYFLLLTASFAVVVFSACSEKVLFEHVITSLSKSDQKLIIVHQTMRWSVLGTSDDIFYTLSSGDRTIYTRDYQSDQEFSNQFDRVTLGDSLFVTGLGRVSCKGLWLNNIKEPHISIICDSLNEEAQKYFNLCVNF